MRIVGRALATGALALLAGCTRQHDAAQKPLASAAASVKAPASAAPTPIPSSSNAPDTISQASPSTEAAPTPSGSASAASPDPATDSADAPVDGEKLRQAHRQRLKSDRSPVTC